MSYPYKNAFSLSQQEKVWPGTIKRVTGYMDYCTECGKPFRRLGDRSICGACYPAPLVTENKIPYCDPASSQDR